MCWVDHLAVPRSPAGAPDLGLAHRSTVPAAPGQPHERGGRRRWRPGARHVVGVSGDAARPEREDDVGLVPPDGIQNLFFQLLLWDLIEAAIAIVAHLHILHADEPGHLAQVLLAPA